MVQQLSMVNILFHYNNPLHVLVVTSSVSIADLSNGVFSQCNVSLPGNFIPTASVVVLSNGFSC